jgi:hypothetical protein
MGCAGPDKWAAGGGTTTGGVLPVAGKGGREKGARGSAPAILGRATGGTAGPGGTPSVGRQGVGGAARLDDVAAVRRGFAGGVGMLGGAPVVGETSTVGLGKPGSAPAVGARAARVERGRGGKASLALGKRVGGSGRPAMEDGGRPTGQGTTGGPRAPEREMCPINVLVIRCPTQNTLVHKC